MMTSTSSVGEKGEIIMYGPKKAGHWTALDKKSSFENMIPGKRYTVIKSFLDYDDEVHVQGEEWIFLGSDFLPYEEGLSLFVSLGGKQEWHIRLQWRPETQGTVLDAWDEYVRPSDTNDEK